ncbi:MAG: hypothetical protein SFW67_04075 [Myxococcaceae bacterium]|nr:hypothetical protein [Myxococcaceae bacterium]
MNDYEFSAAYVDTVLRSLRRHPSWDALLAKLSPAALALAKDPWSQTWQPARLLEEVGEVAVATVGGEAFETATHTAMRDRFGPIVLPMLKSSLAASNRSPATVLKKLNELVKVAIRGIDVLFQADAENRGVLQVAYPRPVAPHVLSSWQGVLRFVFEATTPGTITQTFHAPHGATLQFAVEWPLASPK